MKLQKKTYESRAEKKRDFLIGLVVFLGLNALLYLIAGLTSYLSQENFSEATNLMVIGFWYALPLLVNIGVLVYFGLTRSWIALGMLGTFAGMLLLAVVLGVIASVVCLVMVVASGG